MKERLAVWALLACLLLVVASSGCVDIHGARELFGKKPAAGKMKFRDRNKVEIVHGFQTTASADSLTFTATCRTEVKPGTQVLTVLVSVTILDISSLPLPLPIPIPNNTFERYVRVKVTMADGTLWIDSKLSSSGNECSTAANPIDGPWSVRVEAAGIGLPALGIQDMLKVMVGVREPI